MTADQPHGPRIGNEITVSGLELRTVITDHATAVARGNEKRSHPQLDVAATNQTSDFVHEILSGRRANLAANGRTDAGLSRRVS